LVLGELFDIGGIVDHHRLEVVVCFADIGGIVDHHCLEVVVCFVYIGKKALTVKVNNSTNINKTNNNLSPKETINSDGQQFHHYQQNKQ
jgi:hypothetical protein